MRLASNDKFLEGALLAKLQMMASGIPSTLRKHNEILLSSALVLFGSLFFAQTAGTQSANNLSKLEELRPRFVPGEVLVRYRSEAAAHEQSKESTQVRIEGRDVRMRVEKIVDNMPGLRLVHVEDRDTLKVVESLKARADVLYAEPNFLRYRLATPNDPLFENLWALGGSVDSAPKLFLMSVCFVLGALYFDPRARSRADRNKAQSSKYKAH